MLWGSKKVHSSKICCRKCSLINTNGVTKNSNTKVCEGEKKIPLELCEFMHIFLPLMTRNDNICIFLCALKKSKQSSERSTSPFTTFNGNGKGDLMLFPALNVAFFVLALTHFFQYDVRSVSYTDQATDRMSCSICFNCAASM